MRFNVISLAFALAVPVMSVQVGWRVGQDNGVLQEYDTSSTTIPAAVPAVTPAPTTGVANKAAQTQVSNKSQSPADNKTTKGAETTAKSTPTTEAEKQSPTTAAKASATPTSGSGSGSTGGSSGSGGTAPKGGQILYIVNKYGAGLSVITGNSGGPAPTGGSPSLANGATATITLQSGWAGRFAINPTGVPDGNQDGTKIEGALTSNGFWDISLVDGYTVPITCTCDSDSTPFIGCNIDLFKQSAKCPSPNGNALCENPARSANNGPANPWFAACKDAAYTYPDNDVATQTCSGEKLTCCVGTSCAAGKNQGKRSINPVYARWAFPRNAFDEQN